MPVFTYETTDELSRYPERPPAAQMGWVTLDCRAGDAQGELCCVKAMLREREKRFKRLPAETSCRHHAQTLKHPLTPLQTRASSQGLAQGRRRLSRLDTVVG